MNKNIVIRGARQHTRRITDSSVAQEHIESEIPNTKHIPKRDVPNLMIELETKMREAADRLDFEDAIRIREKLHQLKKRLD